MATTILYSKEKVHALIRKVATREFPKRKCIALNLHSIPYLRRVTAKFTEGVMD